MVIRCIQLSKRYYEEVYLDCPVCGTKKSFVIRQTIYDIPHQGPTVIVGAKCTKCGYKFTWTLPYEQGEEFIHEIKVENESDLNTLVYIGENTDVQIPELGVEILSSDLDPGYITTIEGIIIRIKEKVEKFCQKNDKCIEEVNKLEKSLRGEMTFTLKLVDHYGRSCIMSNKATKRLVDNS